MRILYADSGLRSLEGHHASSGVAIPAAFRRLGHHVTVIGYRELHPDLQRATGARPMFRAFTYGGRSSDELAGWLTNFVETLDPTVADLRKAWSRFGPFDLLYFNSARAPQVAALCLWLMRRFPRPGTGPAIVVELGTEAGLSRSGPADKPVFAVRHPAAHLYRHVAEWLGRAVVGRLTFVAAAATSAEEHGYLLGVPVSVVPLPQALPTLRRREVGGTLTIGLLGHQRADKGWQFAPEFIPAVLKACPTVRFIAHHSDPDSTQEPVARATAALVEQAGCEPRLELLLKPVVGGDWFALLDRCDIVAMPYDPARYRESYSAVLGESIAAGAPVVVPAATTLSEMLKTMNDAGTAFDRWDAPSIAAATRLAVEQFPVLAERAWLAGRGWAEKNGPDQFVRAVIAAANLDGARRRTGWRFGFRR